MMVGALVDDGSQLRMHVDVRRGDVSTSLAALVEAVGHGYRDVPQGLAACAMAVVGAVDRATGNRRFD